MATVVRKIISTAKAPAALGPYSQAVLVDRTMYIAGQIGIEPASGQLVSGGAKEEAKQALKNMGEILKAAGCDYCNVVKTTVLMADMKDFNDINDIYRQFFNMNFPARAAYQVAALPKCQNENSLTSWEMLCRFCLLRGETHIFHWVQLCLVRKNRGKNFLIPEDEHA
uniref:Reactive intermediate imine deaminase A homolog n=1 Tax=Apteryx owenii TaxID=8824 RepID=A0A8B9NTI0_APTOW